MTPDSRLDLHLFRQNPDSPPAICLCGAAEISRAHPHPFRGVFDTGLCRCGQPPAHAIHDRARRSGFAFTFRTLRHALRRD